jgi:hypothetical protein
MQDWRLELASFSYTVEYRPGKDNVVPDSFTRAFTSSMSTSEDLMGIHTALSHPGNSNAAFHKVEEFTLFHRRCQEDMLIV